ncbi:MAG: hypothetical protein RL701_2070 [Pseudomonadota bacterium]|jgi:poly(3-hydroxybutyrate) depolymerase
MPNIAHKLCHVLAVVLLSMPAAACHPRDIDLGERGGAFAAVERDAGEVPGSAGQTAGTSGFTASAGQDAGAAGSFAAAAGFSGASGATAGSAANAGAAGGGGAGMVAVVAGRGGAAAGAGGSSAASRSSTGCGKEPAPTDASILVNGLRASYLVDLPVDYDKTRAYPLVLAFRADDTTPDAFRKALNLAAVTGADAIAVYPNCLDDAAAWDNQRDLPLFDPLLSKLKASYCVDLDRMFVLGQGAGAALATAVGCFYGDELRATAPLSSAQPPGGCVGKPAAWIMQANGDPMTSLGLGRANRDYWATHNGCNVRMSTPIDPMPCVTYAGCDANAPVCYCEYDGDSAAVPSFAASGIWRFFKGL